MVYVSFTSKFANEIPILEDMVTECSGKLLNHLYNKAFCMNHAQEL